MPVTGKLAAKCNKYLLIWRSTCGGEDFMRLGMSVYWKDQVESPRRLRMPGSGRQKQFSPEENRKLGKLLQEEITEEIVMAASDEFAAHIHFRMEGSETVMYLMRRGDWLTSIDLKSAFNHLIVNEAMRTFLCFRYAGQCYSYAAMPFGSKHAPRLFTEALGHAVRHIRQN